MLPFGTAGGIIALAGGLTLWFGRRLPIWRARHGCVRVQDQAGVMCELGSEDLTSY